MPEPQRPPHRFSFLKFLGILGIIFVVLVTAVFTFKDEIIRRVGEKAGSAFLGARVEMGQFYWNFFSQKIVVKELIVYHPPGFGGGRFIDIPQIVVEYDLGDLLKGNTHMQLVSVDLAELIVIKNQSGVLNVDAIKVLHPEKKEKFEVPQFQIDELKLNVDKVVFKDSYKKPVPKVLVYDLNLKNRTFKNINNASKLVTVVMTQALKPTAIQSVGLYAAATMMGVGFLPGAVLGIVVAKDASTADLAIGAGKAFAAALKFVKEKGRVTKSDKATGTIEGNVQGVDIKIKVEKVGWFKSRMTVAGRRYMMPQKEFAAGILYQIGQRL
jgi:hypothetical protein